MGLAEVAVTGPPPHVDLLVCFLAEAMREFQSQGVTLVEVQTDPELASLAEACQKLGFLAADRGMQFRQPVDRESP